MSLLGLFGSGGLLDSKDSGGLLGKHFSPNMPLLMTGLGMMGGGWGGALPGLQAGMQHQRQAQGVKDWETTIKSLGGGGQGAPQPGMPMPAVPSPMVGIGGPSPATPAATFVGPSPASPAGVKAAAAGRVPDDAARNTYALAIQAGMPPMQAAVWAGNVQQESSFNPSALNKGEGAFGLIQWRESRRRQLEEFARKRGTRPDDPETQARFSLWEMTEGPPEQRRPGQAFLAARTPEEANQALKGYIRYGDDSYQTRLNNARNFLGSGAPAPQATGGGAIPSPQQQQAFVNSLPPQEVQALARLAAQNPQVASAILQQKFKAQQPPTYTDDQREFLFALQRGEFKGTFPEWQARNAKGNEPPSGYRWTQSGGLEPIPGGPAVAKQENWIPLTTPQERAAFGIPADSKQAWQYNPVTKKVEATGSGGGQNVTVQLPPGEKKYDEARGTFFAGEAERIAKEGREAEIKVAQYQRLDALLSDPNVYTGTGAESIQALKKMGSTLFGLDFKGVGSAEAAQKIVSELALQMGQLMKPMSDSDRRFLETLPPNLANSAQGRKFIVQMTIDAERRKQQIARLARAYEKTVGRLDADWEEDLAEYLKDNPLFTPERQSQIKGLAEGTQQPPPSAGITQRAYNVQTGKYLVFDPAQGKWVPE